MIMCNSYQEREVLRFLTEYEQGIAFAKTGKRITHKIETEGYCIGTKECDVCKCNGNPEKCDFYPEKRKNIKGLLKPCPFCGGNVEVQYIEPFNYIQCFSCGLNMACSDINERLDQKEVLINKWNRRVKND